MTLLLKEQEVLSLLDMKEVIQCLERAFVESARGMVHNIPRTRSFTSNSVLNVMHASLEYINKAGLKAYVGTKNGTRFALLLFDTSKPELLSVMAADMLGRYRTGAASALATKYMYGERKLSLAVAGTGNQAYTQVKAMNEIFELERVRVWSRTRENALRFVNQIRKDGINAEYFESLDLACSGSDVLTTITSAREPFVKKEHLSSIKHVNACGSNASNRSELTTECFDLIGTVCVDSLEQSKVESGDLINAVRDGRISWEKVVELKDVVSGKIKPVGRTLFKSNGVALEDVSVASMIYEKAKKEGIGYEFEFSP